MTHTEQLRRALRAYDLAGPETPEHTEAFAQDLLNLAKAQREAVAGMVLQETKEAIPPEQTVVPVRKEASHG